ncbi:MAG TPA: rhodanese-like domain-containing protein [Terracidiphilus sp.]|nr:rhodanese-like domain-containing protein [Terracidiphilus sp.]
MTLTYFLVLAAIAIAYMLFKRSGRVKVNDAVEYLKSGATVIDVRTEAEFEAGHLSQAVNLPLDRVEALVPSFVTDKNKVLLLHCQNGIRSGAAKRKLADIGYTNVFNLGSYERALRIVSTRRK